MQIRIEKISDGISPQIDSIISAFSSSGRRRVLAESGDLFVKMTKNNFGGNGQYRSKAWKPLSEEYAKKVGSDTPTDKRSGKLMNSIRKTKLTDKYVLVSTNNLYAAAICFGSKLKHIPPRNFWPVDFMGDNIKYSRLVIKAQREMYMQIVRRFHQLSHGVLPISMAPTQRMPYQFGNVFAAPTSML